MTKVALITGGAVRLGKAMAISLAQQGMDIALHYNTSARHAQATAADIRKLSRRCELFQADLTDSTEVENLIPSVIASMGRCDVLVNNAAVFIRAGLAETDEKILDLTLAVNFKAPLILMRSFAHQTKIGKIINMLDSRIATTKTAYFAYTLSKKALADCTKLAAKEFAPNIKVNGICPGLIIRADGNTNAKESSIPQGNVKDITDALQYLLNSEFVTGELLFVDGGDFLN